MQSVLGTWDAEGGDGAIVIEPTPGPLLGVDFSRGLPGLDDLSTFVHPDDLAGLRRAVLDLLGGRSKAMIVEFRVRHADGHWIWIEASGRVKGNKLSGVWTDISARMASLARKDEAVSRVHQFAAAASHDLIGPLRHIAMYGDLLLEDFGTGATQEKRQMLVTMAEKARQLQVLTKRLIAFSTGTAAPEFRAVPLDETVRDVSQMLADPLEQSKAKLSWGDLPTVTGDPVLIEKVFANLIANALEWAGGHSPEIQISASTAGSNAVILVADNGTGIDPRYATRIFDAFWSVPKQTGEKGAGLGLSVCKSILHALEGDIRLRSSSREDGSVFEITLPLNR
ncbi:sensor histidine kinase [Rhizobium sp. LjRoot254]|uniref:sensor histidine kinase n=1 Tax=Rhizobium sp. LjRoot254 TaxID=3342297 RepID=UPI003ED10988